MLPLHDNMHRVGNHWSCDEVITECQKKLHINRSTKPTRRDEESAPQRSLHQPGLHVLACDSRMS